MPSELPKTEKLLLSIIVPMCNEEASIDLLRGKLLLLQERIAPLYNVEYCLVDDGSTDNTPALMATAGPEGSSVVCERHEQNRGVGAAIRTGFKMAKGSIVCTIDADCSYSPENLYTLIELVASGHTDIAVASPYHPDGGVLGVRPWRLLLSRQCSRLYRWISPLKLYTYTSIFRAYSGEAARALNYWSDGFVSAVEVLLCAQHRGYKVREAPMVLHARQRGYSKMRIANTIAAHLSEMRREAFRRVTRRLSTERQVAPAEGARSGPISTAFPVLEQTNSTQ